MRTEFNEITFVGVELLGKPDLIHLGSLRGDIVNEKSRFNRNAHFTNMQLGGPLGFISSP